MMDDRALFIILRCVEKTDGQVGRGEMLKLLLGQDSRKLSKLKLVRMDLEEGLNRTEVMLTI